MTSSGHRYADMYIITGSSIKMSPNFKMECWEVFGMMHPARLQSVKPDVIRFTHQWVYTLLVGVWSRWSRKQTLALRASLPSWQNGCWWVSCAVADLVCGCLCCKTSGSGGSAVAGKRPSGSNTAALCPENHRGSCRPKVMPKWTCYIHTPIFSQRFGPEPKYIWRKPKLTFLLLRMWCHHARNVPSLPCK